MNRLLNGLIRRFDPTAPQSALIGEPWFIDRLITEGGQLVVEGWAFPPGKRYTPHGNEFSWNGRPFEECRVMNPRPDVGSKFWIRANSTSSGFRCVVAAKREEMFPNGYLRITYNVSADDLPAALRRSWYLFDPELEGSMPLAPQRFRVIGNEDEFGFRLGGATDFGRLLDALGMLQLPLESFEAILDWGVGCGRVARYASRGRGSAFHGCDVDLENVNWCDASLEGRYRHVGMEPPLPYQDGAFDLVYGISVFTHFREPLQDAWLKELQRITRPGAILLMTIHGETALDYLGLQPTEHREMQLAIRKSGLFVSSKNDQLDGAVEGAAEYVNVFHDKKYLARHWRRWFKVLSVLPGFVFTHDLVVLQRV